MLACDLFLKPRIVAACVCVVILGFIVYVLLLRRTAKPEEWAVELEQCVEDGDRYTWKDATSWPFADPQLERLRRRLAADFNKIDTEDKAGQLRPIIEALRRGEVPE